MLHYEGEGERPRGCAKPENYDWKERQMASVKIITQKLNEWRRYREAVREPSQMSDNELADIGISRCDIGLVARQTVAR
jgi:uncharacterized protein YjiS (DUF1127 family)